MELKSYQREVLDDLDDYLDLLEETKDPKRAFDTLWMNKGVQSKPKREGYKGIDATTPDVCLKVPTGGGKTFLAVSALRRIFEKFPLENKVVLWMVPNSAIYEQVLRAFRDPEHEYRKRLDNDFQGRVQVVDIEDMIVGCDFTLPELSDRLTLAVLSYQSLRSEMDNKKLRSNRDNPQLGSFSVLFDYGEIEYRDSPPLKDVLSKLHPVVVLDESHNADTELSRSMLKKLSPSFILELTATPKANSSVISIVSAIQLKQEEMVKIPIFLFGRAEPEYMLADVIKHRNRLEELAREEEAETGRYLRPIALIQAQSRNNDYSVTFDKIRDQLVAAGVPREYIAIKLATRDELRGVDLTSKDCQIRYIITVNALREGWDCPFAYILCTMARGKSEVEVEQILGRILRQPGARRFREPFLNASYVFSMSETFNSTIQSVAKGLLSNGFSERDYVAAKLETYDHNEQTAEKAEKRPSDEEEDKNGAEVPNVDPERLRRLVERTETDVPADDEGLRKIIEEFGKEETRDGPKEAPLDMYDSRSKMREEFVDEMKNVTIPVFVYQASGVIDKKSFTNELSRDYLMKGFNPAKEMNRTLDLTAGGSDMAKYDTKGESPVLALSVLKAQEQKLFEANFEEAVSMDSPLVNRFIEDLSKGLNAYDNINRWTKPTELKEYLTSLVRSMSIDEVNGYRRNIPYVVDAIKRKMDTAMMAYREERFKTLIETSIMCDNEHVYRFPKHNDPRNGGKEPIPYANSLYEKENIPNDFESSVLTKLMGVSTLRWWHRIVPKAQGEFAINGYINDHYPDFVVMTESGHIVLIETKGSHLKNDDSKMKLYLGKKWAEKAGTGYHYYMVFEDKDRKLDGSISVNELLELLEGM